MRKEIFNSIVDVLDFLKKDIPVNPLGPNASKEEYEWIDYGDADGGRIMPSLNSTFISPFIYRGQNKCYQPCLSTIYRSYPLVQHPQNLTQKQRDKYLISQMRIQEFFYLLKSHPLLQYSKEIGLHLNNEGLAQHYGFQTDLLDLTQDYEVAAFFACCKLNKIESWEPISEGTGIIYRVDITSLHEKLFKLFELVGLHIFPRPGEQKAWTFKLPLGTDFEQFSFDTFEFKHNRELSENLLNKFNCGKTLFPFDLMANKAEMINKQKSIPLVIAENVLLKHNLDSSEVNNAVNRYCKRFENQFNITIDNRELIVFPKDELIELNELLQGKKKNSLKNVGVRPVKHKK